MKNATLGVLSVGLAIVGLFAFNPFPATGIKGRVEPADGVKEVWAVSATGTDSARAVLSDGAFQLDEKAGTYNLVVRANPPYKDVVKDNVQVADGSTTDLGTIMLQQ